MKKFLLVAAFAAFTLASQAASYVTQPMLNGYNLYVTNGGVYTTGQTNNLYTSLNGQILFSLTNNVVNGTLNTNTLAGDAFDLTTLLRSDMNGDVVANASIAIYLNNTNLIPVAVTNNQGQWFVFTGNTNGLPTGITYPAFGWPLVVGGPPVYTYPATTNLYPSLPSAAMTNAVTFNFQRGFNIAVGTGSYIVWDTSTNVFACTMQANGLTPVSLITNLPTAFAQGADRVRLQSVVLGTNSAAGTSGGIVNQVVLIQPQP